MRTTISIDPHLLTTAKAAARERGMTLGRLVEEALRRELADDRTQDRPVVPVFRGGGGLRPGVEVDSSRALQELFDESAPPEALR